MANRVDPDMTAPSGKEQSDLGLHCLPRPVCRKKIRSLGTRGPFTGPVSLTRDPVSF